MDWKYQHNHPQQKQMNISPERNGIKENNNIYRGEDYLKKFCKSLREHAMVIINLENNKMRPLTNEQTEWNCIKRQKTSTFMKRSLNVKTLRMKIILKLKTIDIIQVNAEVLHIPYIINKIPVVFYNGWNYDYHFIIKKLANEFKGELNCL